MQVTASVPTTTVAHGARPSWALDVRRRFDQHLTDHIHHSCLALHA